MTLGTVTIYRDDSVTPVVYEKVKHAFLTGGNTVLTIAVVTNEATGHHHYVNWPVGRIAWWTFTKPEPEDLMRRLGLR